MTQVAELLLEEGRKEGLILSGKIFRVVRECSDLFLRFVQYSSDTLNDFPI